MSDCGAIRPDYDDDVYPFDLPKIACMLPLGHDGKFHQAMVYAPDRRGRRVATLCRWVEDKDAVCDFCSAIDPVWEYECSSFDADMFGVKEVAGEVEVKRLAPTTTEVGAWLACEKCAVCIEEGIESIVSRVVPALATQLDPANPRVERGLRDGLYDLYTGFYANKRGRHPWPTYTGQEVELSE